MCPTIALYGRRGRLITIFCSFFFVTTCDDTGQVHTRNSPMPVIPVSHSQRRAYSEPLRFFAFSQRRMATRPKHLIDFSKGHGNIVRLAKEPLNAIGASHMCLDQNSSKAFRAAGPPLRSIFRLAIRLLLPINIRFSCYTHTFHRCKLPAALKKPLEFIILGRRADHRIARPSESGDARCRKSHLTVPHLSRNEARAPWNVPAMGLST